MFPLPQFHDDGYVSLQGFESVYFLVCCKVLCLSSEVMIFLMFTSSIFIVVHLPFHIAPGHQIVLTIILPAITI